jgi:hypothetical protein
MFSLSARLALVRMGGRTVEQGRCVQQGPQLLSEAALPAGVAQVSDPGACQFVANRVMHRGLLGAVTGLYPEDAAKAWRRGSGDCLVSGGGASLDLPPEPA